jgi:hypothetical protein
MNLTLMDLTLFLMTTGEVASKLPLQRLVERLATVARKRERSFALSESGERKNV